MFKGLKYKLKSKKILVGKKKAKYAEVELYEPDKINIQTSAVVTISEITPVLEIQFTANDKKDFEFNRGRMESILNSFIFE